MTGYISQSVNAPTPQSEPAREDQVKNNAGGYVFAIDKWARLRRFLILGSEGGTYYVDQRKLTLDNVKCVQECLAEDGKRVVDVLLEVSEGGLSYKQDPTMYALALAIQHDDVEVRRYASEAVHRICRTASHMQMFMAFCRDTGRGWGRIMRRTVRRWFSEKADAYQLVKYQQRNGWANRDLLRLAHIKPENEQQAAEWKWAVGKYDGDQMAVGAQISAHEILKTEHPADKVAAQIIEQTHLPFEAVPSEYLSKPEIWEALLQDMPMTAMIRNLARLTSIGLVAPLSAATNKIVEQLHDEERLKRARVHPIQVLAALATYESGHGVRGSLSWTPVPRVLAALDDAFYATFKNVEPTNKRFLLGLDVSGSMGWGQVVGVPNLTPARVTAAMSMLTARTEQQHHIMGFADQFRELGITASDSLAQAMEKVVRSNFGGTNASLPMSWAREHKVPVDTFVVYTDNETWVGRSHPFEELKLYRKEMDIDSKLMVVATSSTGFTIADPSDAGMLDVAGFDPSVPEILRSFTLGQL